MGWLSKKGKPKGNSSSDVAREEIEEATKAIEVALAHARIADHALDAYIRIRKR